MAAGTISQGEFINEVIEHVAESRDLSRAEVKAVLDSLVEVTQSNLRDGYAVPLLGLVKLTPTFKAGRKKGTEVRNPFDGTTKKLTKNEPDTVKVKARPMAKAKVEKDMKPAALKNLIDAIR